MIHQSRDRVQTVLTGGAILVWAAFMGLWAKAEMDYKHAQHEITQRAHKHGCPAHPSDPHIVCGKIARVHAPK